MNLARILSSASPNPQKWLLYRLIASFPFSTAGSPAKRSYKRNPQTQSSKTEETASCPVDSDDLKLPRPSEIPFQPKVANLVQLVGTIGVPVQLQTSPEGVYSAASVLVHEKTVNFPRFWIPVIFQGDLAKIAACHLNERDHVYITGQLSGDAPPVKFENVHANVQVLAHTLSFVQGCLNDRELAYTQKAMSLDFSAKGDEDPSTFYLWVDLLTNPRKWWDNRSNNLDSRSPAFRHKDNGQVLFINKSTPEWVIKKLDAPTFSQRTEKVPSNGTSRLAILKNLWSDLIDNPQNWQDYRINKLNPKFPDFKHKDTRESLWLNTAPAEVLPKLDGLQFAEGNSTTKTAKILSVNEKENLWKDLVENPKNWWDNRSDKLKLSQPDFKHKVTGQVLWLDSSTTPSWVLADLPPPSSKSNDARMQDANDAGKQDTVLT
ncbi:Single-stranded DNA-binding protein [Dioscorea alata]|uniref:Single-stranded DNA-binding protein n=1 Tax=Dioscorea alata TaxID=55571 RepID=A0ACB7VKM2_DIOAL|nr:Single-stranded DNA-binding protein [Dioscorea alata]